MRKGVSKQKIFEQEYFTGHYRKMAGEFSQKDLERNEKWFYGWFKFLNKYFDFENGKGRGVLEIGCGIGGAAAILAERNFQIWALDISKYVVQRAKKLSSKVKFFACDVQKEIPIQKKFDLVYAFEVIEHLEDPFSGIKNMYRVLKPGGTVICSTPNNYPHVFSDPTHINVKTPSEWQKIFAKVGFKNLIIRQISFLPFLWRVSKYFNLAIPFAISFSLVNSPVFIIGTKAPVPYGIGEK